MILFVILVKSVMGDNEFYLEDFKTVVINKGFDGIVKMYQLELYPF